MVSKTYLKYCILYNFLLKNCLFNIINKFQIIYPLMYKLNKRDYYR